MYFKFPIYTTKKRFEILSFLLKIIFRSLSCFVRKSKLAPNRSWVNQFVKRIIKISIIDTIIQRREFAIAKAQKNSKTFKQRKSLQFL